MVGARGTRLPFPLIFRPNWGPKGQKHFLETEPPPYLGFWMTAPQLPEGRDPPLQTPVGLRSFWVKI